MSEQPSNDPQWERGVLEKLALASLREQRAARRWGVFFKLSFLLYLVVLLVIGMGWFGKRDALPGKHTALVEISGIISPNSQASADRIMGGLQSAFKDKNTKGIVLRINSPGGSPVQAGYIYDEIKRLRGNIRKFRSTRWSRTSAPPAVITSRRRPTASMSTRPASSVRSAC